MADFPRRSPLHATVDCGPPMEAAEEPPVIELYVPDDALPGTKLEWIAPDGQELRLTVPEGVPPGSLMTLSQDPATGKWKCMAEPGEPEEHLVLPSVRGGGATYETSPGYTVPATDYAVSPGLVAEAPPVTRYRTSHPGTSVSSAARPVTAGRPVNHSYMPGQGDHVYTPPVLVATPMRPSYTPPPVVHTVTRAPSYTPPGGSSALIRPPSYVPPPTVQQPSLTARPSYTPPPVVERMPSYTPTPVVVRESRPSYTPPPVAVLEQRPSYTPLPQILAGGVSHSHPSGGASHSHPVARVSRPTPEASIMATTVSIQPQQIVQQLGAGQAASYVPPPATIVQASPSYIPPVLPVAYPQAGQEGVASGPSITTLPPQDQMIALPQLGAHAGMPAQGSMAASMPGMGMHQMTHQVGSPMAAHTIGIPPMNLQGMQFFQPQIGLPPLAHGLMGTPPLVQPMGFQGGAAGAAFGGLGQMPAHPLPGQSGGYNCGVQPPVQHPMSQPPLMACG